MWERIRRKLLKWLIPEKQYYVQMGAFHSQFHSIFHEIIKGEIRPDVENEDGNW